MMWIFILFLLVYFDSLTCGFQCSTGVTTFFKVSMRQPDPSFSTSEVLVQEVDHAILPDCIKHCKDVDKCEGFTIDFKIFTCHGSLERIPDSNLTTGNAHFFQKSCYQQISRSDYDSICGKKLWSFDKVIGATLNLNPTKKLNVLSLDECSQRCLTETEFTCKSADFDQRDNSCSLSKETRRSQPQAFREGFNISSIYIENQCTPARTTPCIYITSPDAGLISMDGQDHAVDEAQCQEKCNKTREFNCRSYSFQETKCSLSSDDKYTSYSLPPPFINGSVYGEITCEADDCLHGTYTYEKVPGHSLESAFPSPLDIERPDKSVTSDCRTACDETGFICPAFIVNHGLNNCEKLDRNSQGRSKSLLPATAKSYYEKVCLTLPTDCRKKLWSFIRIPGYSLDAKYYNKTLHDVQSRRDCKQLCLNEKFIKCRSALYDAVKAHCQLSQENRQTKQLVKVTDPKISYLENDCLTPDDADQVNSNKCPFTKEPGYKSTFFDILHENVTSDFACQTLCENNRQLSVCRSFSYSTENNQCMISSEDSKSTPQLKIKSPSPDYDYYERKCETPPESSTYDYTGGPTDNSISTPPVSTSSSSTTTTETTTGSPVTTDDEDLSTASSGNNRTTGMNQWCLHMSKQSHQIFMWEQMLTSRKILFVFHPFFSSLNIITMTWHIVFSSKCRTDTDELTYERIPGFEPLGNHYYVNLCYGTSDNPAIINECKVICSQRHNCRGFIVDYSKKYCYGMFAHSMIDHVALQISPEKDFFQAKCLPKSLYANNCQSKLWSTERIIDQTVIGVAPRYILPFINVHSCKCLCLEERRFTCRSFIHEKTNSVCKIYDRNRETGLLSLSFKTGSDFYENSCAYRSTLCRYSPHQRDMTIRSLMKSLKVRSMSECRTACDADLMFDCRSFSFVDRMLYTFGSENLCLLSSDNQLTSKTGSLRYSPRSFYYEKECYIPPVGWIY